MYTTHARSASQRLLQRCLEGIGKSGDLLADRKRTQGGRIPDAILGEHDHLPPKHAWLLALGSWLLALGSWLLALGYLKEKGKGRGKTEKERGIVAISWNRVEIRENLHKVTRVRHGSNRAAAAEVRSKLRASLHRKRKTWQLRYAYGSYGRLIASLPYALATILSQA